MLSGRYPLHLFVETRRDSAPGSYADAIERVVGHGHICFSNHRRCPTMFARTAAQNRDIRAKFVVRSVAGSSGPVRANRANGPAHAAGGGGRAVGMGWLCRASNVARTQESSSSP